MAFVKITKKGVDMDLVTTIRVNQQIVKLIKSKYPEETWPAGVAKNAEVKYYLQLEDDLAKAQSALVGGGIASKVVES